MKDVNKKTKKLHTVFERIMLVAMACMSMVLVSYGAEAENNRKLQNGSFEKGQTFTKDYEQPDQKDVPSWNTTAFQGKIELFRKNKGTYFNNGVTLAPSHGTYAAELNADEESTLYQVVNTTPSSVYEWGLDHGARNGADTMALVIGPNQSVPPSKPAKDGRDQFMQMIDWLIDQGKTSVKTSAGVEKQLTVYSKKFAANGTFADNAGNNAFSLTPSTIYTEEWHIWIMSSTSATSGTNPWNHYGANAEGTAGTGTSTGTTEIDLSKYYLYTVPAGQTETLFGFVSVGYVKSQTTADKAKTYGNFLDGINFQLYHPLSGSTSNHGSAVVGGSDGTTEGEGASEGNKVTIDDSLATYVTDGEPLKVQAIIKKDDALDGCEFVGVYRTLQDRSGNPVTEFLKLSENWIDDTGSLTDEQKAGKWLKSTDSDENIVYTYYLDNVTAPMNLHFVFIKSPTITYDSNGGKEYVVERTYNTEEAANVYSYKPATGSANAESETGEIFIAPYVSKAAEGQNDGWKFTGWLLTGDIVNETTEYKKVNGDKLGSMVLPAEHTVACDYTFDGVNGNTKAQYFKIYNGNVALNKKLIDESNESKGVTWTDNGEEKAYANVHTGLTMVAQWRWRQSFMPQIGSGSSYTDSVQGGTVEITSVADKSDENYNGAYNANGGKAYFASTDETVTVTAIAKPGYTFEGWYDASGNLVTINTTYSYTETKGSVSNYYARFSDSVTQTYIRQIKNGDAWEDTEDDNVGTLGRYTYTDAVGTPISSTATAKTGYKFVGWYDASGNKVADSMLTNNGATISYTTTGPATYYARFDRAYTVKFAAQTKQKDGSFKANNVGGKVSVTSVSDVLNGTASSKATANSGYKFLGWYDKNGNLLSTDAIYSTTTTQDTNNVTYYARFEIVYTPTVESKVYLSFIAENKDTSIPNAFSDRDAGTDINNCGYGNAYGNTISTGFKYSIKNMTDVDTIQITVTVPDTAYVKVGGTGSFTGNGTPILTDSGNVTYNKGSIQKISCATTLTYYWDATGLTANTYYGFIIDNLYAPGATATITVNGTEGKKVTSSNGVVNTAATEYKDKSHYKK